MAIVQIHLPAVKERPEARPEGCPKCGSSQLQRWGQRRKPIRDHQLVAVTVQRYRCTDCHHCFRLYPEGVGRPDQSLRLITLAALAWALGHSTRGAAWFFAALGRPLGRMSVWRDGQRLAQELKGRSRGRQVRVLGVDGTSIRYGGRRRGVVVAVDLGTGEPIAVAAVDERDPEAVVAWLAPLVSELGVEVIVTDDLFSYRVVTEKLELKQQVCRFHLARWADKALRELARELDEGWQGVIARVQQIVTELPADGDRLLWRLWQQIPIRSQRQGSRDPLYRLKGLILRLSEGWQRYRLYFYQEGVPPTNNGTEQAIGRLKIRSQSVRGYKTWPGVEAGWFLANCRGA